MNVRRILGYVAFAMSVGCVSNPRTPSSITEWRRVHKSEGCMQFRSYRGRAHDINIELAPEFERSLMDELKSRRPEHVFVSGKESDAPSLQQPLCWYEMPSGDVLLRAGYMCDLPFVAQFRRSGLWWSVVRFEQVWIQCDQRAR
jgi:hypothetical protein